MNGALIGPLMYLTGYETGETNHAGGPNDIGSWTDAGRALPTRLLQRQVLNAVKGPKWSTEGCTLTLWKQNKRNIQVPLK